MANPMEIFKGMTRKQILEIRQGPIQMMYEEGELIFKEGDAAEGFFIILKGMVEIYRDAPSGELSIARLGPGEVFGEMGLIIETGTRTAGARASEETVTLKVPGKPVEMFKRIDDTKVALVFLQNLVCLLGKRLRSNPEPELVKGESPDLFAEGKSAVPAEALEAIRRALPQKGLFKKFTEIQKLPAGQMLCKQGDEPEGFYFIHSGTLEIIKEPPDREGGALAQIKAPAIAGEVGYFSNEPRAASLRAIGDVTYTFFSGSDFEKLRKKNPEEALDVLFAAGQFVVHLIVSTQNLAIV